jgi:hypothetical protein
MPITASLQDLAIAHPFFTFVVVVWSLAWKGAALWRSAILRQKKWFIAVLIVNFFGLIEIIYLFFVARKYEVEVVEIKA